ncbi:DUF1415 domain-containing protein [Halotalea alkalilenta]|uniref:DUF1415 domain-containing protein n=1 Tax=Halotalea alkalilenta TaxID=376489 RepID=A0A172YEL9_9GAMM|nr:DUF1415 domain-containing protein [Halotalea alkalilenta]ANF57664.1 hypothetical protein A5892_09475 [Halotalea alkalilenta]
MPSSSPSLDPAVSPHQQPLRQTRDWITRIVVGLDLCPFARRELDAGRVRYRAVDGGDFALALAALDEEVRLLDEDETISTTVIVLVDRTLDFDTYLDWLELAERWLAMAGYEGIYQIASFHPDYRFEGSPASDPAHLTNRAPWPLFHLLREQQLEQALACFPHPERIPERNVALLRELGEQGVARLLTDRGCD